MSMTLQHTLEARTKEAMQIRAEGAELWTRLHSPSTLVAERRELRGAVTAKQEVLDAINDEIKVADRPVGARRRQAGCRGR